MLDVYFLKNICRVCKLIGVGAGRRLEELAS